MQRFINPGSRLPAKFELKIEFMYRSYSELAARIRVPSGFLLGATFIIFARPTPKSLLWGSVISLMGVLLRAAGAGHLAKNQKLATGGPYRYFRHPLYLGSAFAGFGFCLAGGRWCFFLLLIFFFGAVYWPVIRREEAHLRKLFPEEFQGYAGSMPLLAARRGANPAVQPTRFSWRLYWKNHEYEALLGYLAIVLVLFGKMVLRMRS